MTKPSQILSVHNLFSDGCIRNTLGVGTIAGYLSLDQEVPTTMKVSTVRLRWKSKKVSSNQLKN